MKTTKISILVCLFALLLVESSFSGKLVTENPVNIVGWCANYDYRETNPPYWYSGNMNGNTMFVGSEGISGGYFLLAALINPGLGSCLTNHSQIREVKAEWLGEPGEPSFAFSLVPDTCFNQILNHPTFTQCQVWSLLLRPVVWYFEGSWAFTLIYDCDGKQHKQTLEVQPNPPNTIPPKPSGILIEKVGDNFNVSWSMMGTASYLGYRVVVYRDEDNCPIAFFPSVYPSSFEMGTHRVNITVPTTYAGKTIRIENRNSSGMPTPPPGTLGGTPNRALIRTRLPN